MPSPNIFTTLHVIVSHKVNHSNIKMRKINPSFSSLVIIILKFQFISIVVYNNLVLASPQFTAMFVFGDSIIDNGNNNYLSSFAKANYIPYGIDFEGPSGRFTNGKTTIDYIGELIGLPYLPAYASPSARGEKILKGVNYASAGGGILEDTGRNLGQRFSFHLQIENFKHTLNQLKDRMNDHDLSQYLAKSLSIVAVGSNDYINNYLLPYLYPTSFLYSPKDYADTLLKRYTTQILELHSLGLRKFVLGGVGPLGCIPNQIATGLGGGNKCVNFVNNVLVMFNVRLRSLVDQLNKQHPEAIFVYGNIYGVLGDIINNGTAYGFKVTDRGCCGVGRNRGQMTCLPFSVPCKNRSEYVFWDAFHPTQAVHKILAIRAYSGTPSDCYPLNIHQMGLM